MISRRGAFLLASLGATACGSSDGAPSTPTNDDDAATQVSETVEMTCPEKPPNPSRVRVMVVDDGFDVRHPAFDGKIAGCYQVTCPDEPSFAGVPGETDDQAATRLAQFFGTPSADCTLGTKLTLKIDSGIEHFDPAKRAEWNDAMLGKHPLAASTTLNSGSLLYDLEGVDSTSVSDDPVFGPTPTSLFTYHGTATAGAIAYENDVDIVFVERQLGDENSVQQNIPCVPQSELDLELRLLQRQDVRTAYIQSPESGMDETLSDLRRKHGIAVENHSYGVPSTKTLETALKKSGCDGVELGPYLDAYAELDAERDAYLRQSGALDGADPLIFQAAGNDGALIDSAADSTDCTPNRVSRLLVGSYDIYRGEPAVSSFSNYGACVDLYALGEAVVLPGPNGFYNPVFGTSFASPLAARHASMLLKAGADPSSLRDQVLAARDEDRFLPLSAVPAELEFFSKVPISPPSDKPTAVQSSVMALAANRFATRPLAGRPSRQ